MPRKGEGEARGAGEGGRRTTGQQKKKKQKLMSESNQTDAERRQLRSDYRDLKGKAIEQQQDIADPMKNNMKELADENKELFLKTNYPREAVQDMSTLRFIAEAASSQVKKVANGTAGVNLEDFFEKVRDIFGNSSEDDGFNWSKFGGNASMVFLSTPQGGGFLMGRLDKPAKEQKARSKTSKPTDDHIKEVVPETMVAEQGHKGAKQTKDQTQMRISKMRSHEVAKKDTGTKKDMFETLVNPNSFTQTVENIFDFSFFVKNGEGGISIDKETKLPQVSFNGVQGGGAKPPPPKQWIMSFTPANIRELMSLYELPESNIPHRNEGKDSDYFDPLVHGSRESNRQ